MRLIKGRPSKTKAISTVEYPDRFKHIIVNPFTIVIPFSMEYYISLENCLFYLNHCKGINQCEVLLVLYQEKKEELDLKKYGHLNCRIIHSRRNNEKNSFCLSHARNIGIVQAINDWVLCIDSDILFNDTLCLALSALKRKDNKLYWTDRINVSGFPFREKLRLALKKIRFIDSAPYGYFHFFNKNKIIEKIGGYDENMIGWGAEDTDFVNRCILSEIETENIGDYIKCFHIIHDYKSEWKNSDFLHWNSIKENENKTNIKKENLGIII